MQKPPFHCLLPIYLVGVLVSCAAPSYEVRQKKPSDQSTTQNGEVSGSAEAKTDEPQQKKVILHILLETDESPLAAFSLLLRYHAGKAKLENVSAPADSPFSSPFHKKLNEQSQDVTPVRIASFTIDSTPSGTVPVARLLFSSTDPPSTFIRDLELETASDPDGNEIDASVTWKQ